MKPNVFIAKFGVCKVCKNVALLAAKRNGKCLGCFAKAAGLRKVENNVNHVCKLC